MTTRGMTGAFQIHRHDLCEQGRLSFTAEASQLGFPVGRWPMKLRLAGMEGEALLLVHHHSEHEGDVHIYWSTGTVEQVTLTICND